MKTTRKGRKSAAAIVAVVALIVTMLGGTYAYTDYKQHKSNELNGEYGKYEARLVEDFIEVPDWKVDDGAITKKISVANKGLSVEGFGDVYARIQLKEFMEIAPISYTETVKRYMIDTTGAFIYYASEAQAQLAVSANGPYPGHTYALLTDAATKTTGYFIETMDHDPNGQMGKHMITGITYGAAEKVINPGADRATDTNHHGTVTTDAYGNPVLVRDSEECLYTIHAWDGSELQTRQYIEWGLNTGAIITVSEWLAAGTPPVAKWIIEDRDASGWVYWGMAIPPNGGSTANFMETVSLIVQPEGSFYYVIHTELEAVSYDELDKWGDIGDGLKKNAPWIRFNGPTPSEVVEGQTVASPSVTVGPAGAAQGPLEWSSSNTSIATVDANGVVTGVKVGGPVTITVRAPNGARTQYSITVVPGGPIVIPGTNITITGGDITVWVGETKQIPFSLTPSTATEIPTWTSGNANIATVNTEGKVTGVAPGEITVTGRLANNASATVKVTVIRQATNLIFNASSMSVQKGETKQIVYSLEPSDSNEKPTWTSANTGIATVDADGKVTGVEVGTTTVTGKITNGTERTITITVTPVQVPATGISVNPKTMTVAVGQELPIAFVVTPSNSTESPTWASANNAFVTVSADGKVRGEAVTTSPIRVTGSIQAGGSDYVDVTVIQPATGISVNPKAVTIQVGDIHQIAFVVTPANTTEKPTWSSANSAMATVDADGKVEGKAIGTVRITGRIATGASDYIDVTVVAAQIPAQYINITANDMTIEVGATQQIAYTLTPPNATEKPTWSSNLSGIASVDGDGKVTGVAVGTAIITGKLLNNEQDTITVTVTQAAQTISITASSMNVNIGQTLPISYTLSPTGATEKPTWTSSPTGLVTVDANGNVTGVAEGTTTVRGTLINGNYATITVNVNDPTKLPVNNPSGGFTPYRDPNDDDISDGYYEKFNYNDPTNTNPAVNELYHYGSIHLEEIITDGNYTGVTASAVDSKYSAYITTGNDANHNKPSVIFSYRPTNAEVKAFQATNPGYDDFISIPVQVLLTRGSQSATVTINMTYYGCLFTTAP